MLKAGVPLESVKNCMKMDGYVPSLQPSQKPSEQRNGESGGGGGGMFAVLSQIATGMFSLHKPRMQEGGDAKTTGTGRDPSKTTVPTLGDILGAKKKLRSVASPEREKRFEPHDTFPFLKDIRNGAWMLRKVNDIST
jgi:hypothetical protein